MNVSAIRGKLRTATAKDVEAVDERLLGVAKWQWGLGGREQKGREPK